MSEWIEWNGGEMPIPKGTMVQLCYRSGDQAICSAGMSSLDLEFKRISGDPYLATRWHHYEVQSDIMKYKIYKEEPKGHPSASILMEIAKEAAINPEYWKEFQWQRNNGDWVNCTSENNLLTSVFNENLPRRKPRTIRIGSYDVPEPSEAWHHSFNANTVCIKFESEHGAIATVKALQELLGAKQ